MFRTLLAIALTLSVFSALADNDISHVNGGITAIAGQQYGNLSTVNGGIRLQPGAQAKDLDTVNGGIILGDNTQVSSVNAVNGGIKAGEHVKINGDANTVNGGVRLGFHSSVSGDVGTVNGRILIQQTEVGGRVHTVNGDITIGAQSYVHGGILVEKPNQVGISWGKPKIPRIVIGPNATVDGELRFEREVELFVHATAKIGKVIGANSKIYTDTLPARP